MRFIVILRHKETKHEVIKEIVSHETAFIFVGRLAKSMMNIPENWEVVEVAFAT